MYATLQNIKYLELAGGNKRNATGKSKKVGHPHPNAFQECEYFMPHKHTK